MLGIKLQGGKKRKSWYILKSRMHKQRSIKNIRSGFSCRTQFIAYKTFSGNLLHQNVYSVPFFTISILALFSVTIYRDILQESKEFCKAISQMEDQENVYFLVEYRKRGYNILVPHLHGKPKEVKLRYKTLQAL